MTVHQPFVSRPRGAPHATPVRSGSDKTYQITEAILWGIAILTGMLTVAAIHSLPESRARAERQAIAEITVESRTFCEARGLPAGTPAHAACVLDLGQIRANQERRMADALAPF